MVGNNLVARDTQKTVVEKIPLFTFTPANGALGECVPGIETRTAQEVSHNNNLCDLNYRQDANLGADQGVYQGEFVSHKSMARHGGRIA